MKRWAWIFVALAGVVLVLWACHKDDPLLVAYAEGSPEQLRDKGFAHLDRHETDSALLCFLAAAEKYRPSMRESDKKVCASSANNAGYILLFDQRQTPLAYLWLLKAIDMAKETNNDKTLSFACLNISNIYLTYSDINTASLYLKKAFSHAVKCKNWRVAVISVSNMLVMMEQMDRAPYFAQELAAFDKLHMPATPMLNNVRLRRRAVLLVQQKRYDEALALVKKAATHIDAEDGPEIFRQGNEGYQAIILQKAGRPTEALRILNNTIAEARSTSDLRALADLNKIKAGVLASALRSDSAYICLKESQQLADSLFQPQHYGAVRDVGSHYEIEKFTTRLAEVEARRHITAVMLIWSSVALVVLLVIGVVFYIQNKRLRNSYRMLFERSQQWIVQTKEVKRERKDDGPSDASPKGLREGQSQLIDLIDAVMDNPEAISVKEFTIQKLAKDVGSNYHYCSEAINEVYGKSFSTLLAERRVRLACLRLCDHAHYGNLTVEAIASDLGFKSRSNFTSIFKRITGLSPTEYRRQSLRDQACQ